MINFPGAIVQHRERTRGLAAGFALALFLSADAVFVLCYSSMGVAGSPLFTGGFLIAAEIGIWLLSFRREAALLPADYLFLAFLFFVVISVAMNGQTASIKEYMLLVISISAYPACRLIPYGMLGNLRIGFIAANAGVVSVGTVFTVMALAAQWYDPNGKPMVLGFNAAPTHFVNALSFLSIALATLTLTPRRTATISCFVFFPAFVFGASQVRFVFVSLIVSLLVGATQSKPRQRRYVLIIIAAIVVGVVGGGATRFGTTKVFLGYAVEGADVLVYGGSAGSSLEKVRAQARPPSCKMDVNLDNSIAIRAALLRDAAYLTPFGGFFGVGLDGFMALSCIKATEVHNSALQAIIEIGWLGGASLILLVLVTAGTLLPVSRDNCDMLFTLCLVVYVALSCLVYGRISRDFLLFASLGLASGVQWQRKDAPFLSQNANSTVTS